MPIPYVKKDGTVSVYRKKVNKSLTLEQKLEISKQYNRGISSETIAKQYNLSKTTILNYIREVGRYHEGIRDNLATIGSALLSDPKNNEKISDTNSLYPIISGPALSFKPFEYNSSEYNSSEYNSSEYQLEVKTVNPLSIEG